MSSESSFPLHPSERREPYTKERKLKEIAREIALRRSLYPKKIARREMKQSEADERIAVMMDIAKDYGGHGDAPLVESEKSP